MHLISIGLALVSGGSFLFYGFETLFKDPPRGEFERYGMPRARQFVGTAQLLGGAGVLIGLRFAPLGAAAAVGLTVMMSLGLLVRFKIHDSPRLMVPAASLGSINVVLVAALRVPLGGTSQGRLSTADAADSEKMLIAGRDRLSGSLTFTCMPIAPSMSAAKPPDAGTTSLGTQWPASIMLARVTFVAPTAHIDLSEIP